MLPLIQSAVIKSSPSYPSELCTQKPLLIISTPTVDDCWLITTLLQVPDDTDADNKRSHQKKKTTKKKKSSGGFYRWDLNESPPSSPPNKSLLTDFEQCWLNGTCLPANFRDDNLTAQDNNDLAHLKPKVGLNCPNSSSAEEAVYDSTSFLKAHESLTEDQNLAKLSPKEVSSAPLHESICDGRAPEQ